MHKSKLLLLIAAPAAIAAVVFRVAPYTAPFHEARFSRMSAVELSRVQRANADDPVFLYYFGKRLNDRQQFTDAVPVLERAAGLDPDAVRIRDEWARALVGVGRPSVAFGELRQYSAKHPGSAAAQLVLGKFYVTEHNYEAARTALEAAVSGGAGTAEAWSLLAHVRIKLGNTGGAQSALERAIRLRPEYADDHVQLGVILQSSNPARARQELARAVEIAPRDAVCHREYSRILLDSGDAGDAARAEREARRAAQLDPADSHSALMLGRCLAAESRPNEAAPVLEHAAQLDPSDPLPPADLRRVLAQLGDTAGADFWSRRYAALTEGISERKRLMDQTTAHPNDAAAHRRYAAALASVGDVNGCVRQQSMALRTRPDSPLVLIAAARDLDAAGDSARALSLAHQALAAQTNSPESFETLGDILVHLGRLHEAGVEYDRIRDWQPERRGLYRKRIADAAARLAASEAPAEVLLRRAAAAPDPTTAEALAQQAVAADPENTRALRLLLRLQTARGQRQDAVATAKRLTAISPEDGLANALYVVLTVQGLGQRPLNEADAKALQVRLDAARPDSSAVATVSYAGGLLALKAGRAADAVKELEEAARLEPRSADVYAELAEARRRAGDSQGAARAAARAQQIVSERSVRERMAIAQRSN